MGCLFMTVSQSYLSAQEVCARLGIAPSTLYAYVSRGQIRSVRSEERPHSRSKRYHAEDVETLLGRRELRKSPEQVVSRSLDWGVPLLDSEICLIQAGQFYYRGQNACALSQSQTFESVLALLWQSRPPDWAKAAESLSALPVFKQGADRPTQPPTDPVLAMQAGLLALAGAEPRCWDLRPEGTVRTGAQILALMTHILCGHFPGPAGLAQTLAESWLPDSIAAAPLLNQALILCAEHELNISSFGVRCAASAGSHPVQALLAGLACFSGTRHGGAWARVEALLQECERADSAALALKNRLQRGEPLYGFGHPLYPEGDPRWGALQTSLQAELNPSAQGDLLSHVAESVLGLSGEHPSLDFALVALCRLLGLPLSCAPAIFALGRAGGWLAHLQEEYALKRLIRPRARYTGPAPQEQLHL